MLEAANSTPQAAPRNDDAPPGASVVLVPQTELERLHAEIKFQQAKIEALNFEVARLKHWRFGSSSESLDGSTQAVLFDAIVADTRTEDEAGRDERLRLAALLAAAQATPKAAPSRPVRRALPTNLQRIDIPHELQDAKCSCGQPLQRVGQDISEQLDCVPAQFFVLRHIRGKYTCACCQTIQAAPMPAQIIDKGIPAPGLLAQVVIAKHDDHLPLYRQEEIYARSGVHIPRSSMAQWVGICGVRLAPLAQALQQYVLTHRVIHADETPVSLLAPGRGKTKRAYMWVYRTTDYVGAEGKGRAVLYDFTAGRGGENPRRVLQTFAGTLVTDDFSGYHALGAQGVQAALCMAHARRKLFEAYKLNDSPIAGQAVALIAKLYEVEREAKVLDPPARRLMRQQRSKPLADTLHGWLTEQRQRLAKADATAKAIDYTLSNWTGLTRFLEDGDIPIDNNAAENALRPLVVGRKNWLFVGTLEAGERAGVIMSLIESAKLNGHDPWAYLKDVLERLPTLKQRDIEELLPHNWRPASRTPTPTPVGYCEQVAD
jgi:transposase